MKKKLLLLLVSLPLFLQAQDSHFEDGTLDSWSNSDGSTIGLTNETHSQLNIDIASIGQTKYLQKTCDGTNTVSGIMSIKSLDFSGDFLIVTGSAGTVGVDRCEFIIKNSNNFDLNLRIVLTGIYNTKIVTTNPVIIPANSDWMYSFLPMYTDGTVFTLFPGSTPNISVDTVLSTVVSTEIIHNTSVSTEGESVVGSLEIDAIEMRHLLSVKENFLNDIRVFPNPVRDHLFINLPHKTKGTLTLTSIEGRQLLTKELNTEQMQLDLSSIKSKGVYFLKIETPKGTLTKKVIKT